MSLEREGLCARPLEGALQTQVWRAWLPAEAEGGRRVNVPPDVNSGPAAPACCHRSLPEVTAVAVHSACAQCVFSDLVAEEASLAFLESCSGGSTELYGLLC